jgi:hypothetical protein
MNQRTFDIQSTWEGDSIPGPSTTVRKEEVSLSGTATRIRMGEMIGPADQACVRRAIVVGTEVRVGVGGPLSGLDEGEGDAIRLDGVPVDCSLVMRDVNPDMEMC